MSERPAAQGSKKCAARCVWRRYARDGRLVNRRDQMAPVGIGLIRADQVQGAVDHRRNQSRLADVADATQTTQQHRQHSNTDNTLAQDEVRSGIAQAGKGEAVDHLMYHEQPEQVEQVEHLARCVAMTQERRGHGVSTGVYYLGRALVAQGMRTLLVDLTGRHARLQSLMAHGPLKNLGMWTPPVSRPERLGELLRQVRQQTRGRVDALLLDADEAWLERAGGVRVVDYTLVVVEPGAAGEETADHIAHRLGDQLPPYNRVGAVLGRADPPTLEHLPDRTGNRHLAVLGAYPADYLLAAGDDYSLKGGEPTWPHDDYLRAMQRLARQVAQVVPLARLTSVSSLVAPHPATTPPVGDTRDACDSDEHPSL